MPPCSLAFAAGQLDDIVNKYKNTYHRIIKNKPAHVRPSIYVDFNKENNKEDPKFKVSDHVRIWKYKNIFAECYIPNWLGGFKNNVP